MNRIMLNYGGIEFEDFRCKDEDWDKCKSGKYTFHIHIHLV